MAARHKLIPPYHAQSNGIVKRFNITLKVMLRKLANERPCDWDLCIPALLFAYHDAPQSSTGFSPIELIYGHRVRVSLTILKECLTTPYKLDNKEEKEKSRLYIHEMKERLKETCKLAKEHFTEAQNCSQKQFNGKKP